MAQRKNKILFIPESVSLAHVGRCLSLANTLDKNQYEIIFAAGLPYHDFILADGYPVIDLPVQDAAALKKKWFNCQTVFSQDIVSLYVKAEIAVLTELKPDVVIGDFRVTLGISTRVVNVPYASIVDVHWTPISKQKLAASETIFKKIFGYHLFNGFIHTPLVKFVLHSHIIAYQNECRQFQLKFPKTIYEMYSDADYVLCPSLPEMEPTTTYSDKYRYLGPVFWEPKTTLLESLKNLPSDKKIIYLSPGTSGVFDLSLIQVLKQQGYFLIIAKGGQKLDIVADENMIIVDYITPSQIFDKVNVVVTNGGCMSGYQALSYGVPILAFPYNMDQYLFMEVVVQQQAGISLRSEQRSFLKIKEALNQLMSNSTYRQNALRLQKQIKNYDIAKNFNDFLSEII